MATVQEIFSSAQQYANQLATQVDGLTNGLLQLANFQTSPFPQPGAGFGFYDAALQAYDEVKATAPADISVALPSLNAPNAPDLVANIDEVADISVPNLDAPSPTVSIPNAPTFVLPTRPGEMPSFNAPAIPTVPTVTLPTAPDLQTITLPTAPNIDLPNFLGTSPTGDILPPTNTFAWAENAYSSAMMDAVQSKLLADLENGGYGIDTNDEQQLWSRAADREAMASEKAIAEVATEFSRRRFTLPPGTLFRAMDRVKQGVRDAANALSREIALKRADQLVQNRQFTLQQATQVESVLIGFHSARMERMLNAAKYMAEAAVAFYNAQLEQRRVQLQQYQTDAEVFRTRIQGEVEKLNVYRTQIEGVKLITEVDRSRVENYRAQLAGVEALIQVYRTRMDAANVQANIEKLKQEAYAEQIRAYVAEVQAKEVEFRAYQARIQGEEAKVRVYESQVRAHAQAVEAVRTRVQALDVKLRSQTERARAVLQEFDAKNRQYETALRTAIEVSGLDVRVYDAKVAAFRARLDSAAEMARLGVAGYSANTQSFLGTLKHNIEAARFNLDAVLDPVKLRSSIAKDVISIKAQNLSAAMSALNAVAVQSTNS